MPFNYDRIVKLSEKLIGQFGQVITITSRSQGSYNAATSTAAVTETTQVANGVVDNYSLREIDGNLVQVGDVKLILSAKDITTPTANDKVTLADSSIWTIKKVDPVSPGGTPIIYTCQLRK